MVTFKQINAVKKTKTYWGSLTKTAWRKVNIEKKTTWKENPNAKRKEKSNWIKIKRNWGK